MNRPRAFCLAAIVGFAAAVVADVIAVITHVSRYSPASEWRVDRALGAAELVFGSRGEPGSLALGHQVVFFAYYLGSGGLLGAVAILAIMASWRGGAALYRRQRVERS